MKWMQPLYSLDISPKDMVQIKQKLETYDVEGYGQWYVVIQALNPINMMEILSFHQLCIPYYQNCDIRVVGVAKDYDDAKEIVRRIVEDISVEKYNFNINQYFTAEK